MGEYTDNQNFYLSDPDELVDVEQDLNYNLRRADQRIRPLVEYQVTDVPSVAQSDLPKGEGFKWYKTYTNSIWNYHTDPDTGVVGVWQDPNAQVDSWSAVGLSFEPGYTSRNAEESRVCYSSFDGIVRLRGQLMLSSGGEIPVNTTVDFLNLPDSVLPTKSRYCIVHGGNAAAGDFQVFRLFVPAVSAGDKRLEFIKYGGTSASANERYISLNDFWWPINDT